MSSHPSIKLTEIKREIYRLTGTQTTKQFKRNCPEIHKNRDLRYKKSWAEILSELLETTAPETSQAEPSNGPSKGSNHASINTKSASMDDIDAWLDGISVADAKAKERHKQMYYAMGSLLGWSVAECDTRWARIQLQARWKAAPVRF